MPQKRRRGDPAAERRCHGVVREIAGARAGNPFRVPGVRAAKRHDGAGGNRVVPRVVPADARSPAAVFAGRAGDFRRRRQRPFRHGRTAPGALRPHRRGLYGLRGRKPAARPRKILRDLFRLPAIARGAAAAFRRHGRPVRRRRAEDADFECAAKLSAAGDDVLHRRDGAGGGTAGLFRDGADHGADRKPDHRGDGAVDGQFLGKFRAGVFNRPRGAGRCGPDEQKRGGADGAVALDDVRRGGVL